MQFHSHYTFNCLTIHTPSTSQLCSPKWTSGREGEGGGVGGKRQLLAATDKVNPKLSIEFTFGFYNYFPADLKLIAFLAILYSQWRRHLTLSPTHKYSDGNSFIYSCQF